MSYFEFPHTRSYEGDLGYIIKKLNELTNKYDTFFEYNQITVADPAEWDITKQYKAYTIVFNTNDGISFISKQAVPAGIDLSNADYWEFLGPLIIDGDARTEIERILRFITNIYEVSNVASANRAVGDYLVFGGYLWKVTTAVNAGDTYVEGTNVTKTTIENMIDEHAPVVDLTLSTYSNNPIANSAVANRFIGVDSTINGINNDITNINNDIGDINTDISNLGVRITNTNNDLDTEISNRQAADGTINARIDNIASLPAGSTAGDAELMDIRVAWNGRTYADAGSAVRGQCGDLADNLKNIEYSEDYFSKIFTDYDHYIAADGTYTAQANWLVSDYIKVPEYAVGITAWNYVTVGGGDYKMNAFWIACYDDTKTFLGQVVSDASAPNGAETITMLPNTAYVRVNGHYSQINNQTIKFVLITPELDYFPMVVKTDGGAINDQGGITTHARFGYTGYIKVPEWAKWVKTYNIVKIGGTDYPLKDFMFARYDEDLNFISVAWGNKKLDYIYTAIDPTVVKYIRVNYGVDCKADMVIEFSEKAPFSGLTGDFLGDSLTSQHYFTDMLTDLYEITVNDYGVSGTSISNIINHDQFYTRVSGMSTDCDFVFVLGGTNDWGLSATLGTKSDTNANTFYGGLYQLFSALRTRFADKPIFVSNIPQRNWTQDTSQASGIDSNANGNSVMQFNEAIEYMAHRYGCIVVDAFGESGICVSNLSGYTGDGLHFNEYGGKRYAEYIKDVMDRFTPYQIT